MGDDLGKDLEMGSSDEMSDDNQLTILEELDELDDQMSQSWRAAMTNSVTWGR